jgi:hypothetical protein
MGLKYLKMLKKELCLIKSSVYSALQIQKVLHRKEINFTVEWKMGLNLKF